jgi:hypothetical protein
VQRLKALHQTKRGLLMFLCAELAVAYIIASLAINSGALWQYAAGLVLLIGGVRNLVKLIWKIIHDHKTATA